MRYPNEALSQHDLVRELRFTLDDLGSSPFFISPSESDRQRALGRAEELIRGNPRGVSTIHVRYNLGRKRSAMLDELVRHFAAGHSDEAAPRSDGRDDSPDISGAGMEGNG